MMAVLIFLHTNIQYMILQFTCLMSNIFPFWLVKVIMFLLMCMFFTSVLWIASLHVKGILCLNCNMLRKLHPTLYLSFISWWRKKLPWSHRRSLIYMLLCWIHLSQAHKLGGGGGGEPWGKNSSVGVWEGFLKNISGCNSSIHMYMLQIYILRGKWVN